ncbi:radical SAM protein [Pelomonas sp. V22]|uniref:B12-binding domain-containing radical SAM protein n=1 Tax=Pelomonas sp. V22 TaxID=2822139 RepID=UPI0024A7B05F|nr:B12-binding domain-containing radical SAM protein [Pelomonas sp. V22]MDI4633411.1 radical SAM protein [Pelomonas sp. V22]
MLSILVAHSFFLRFDSKQFERAKPYPPLATLQIAALLRGQGHEVSLFDAMLASGLQDFEASLREHAPQVVLLYEDNYNYLSKMCLAAMRRAAAEMTAMARSRGARVIVAGSDVSDAPAPYLQAGADAALQGEGHGALQQLLLRLEQDLDQDTAALTAGLSGVHALFEGQPRVAANSPVAATVVRLHPARQADEMAVAWDLVDVERYRSVWQAAHGRFSLNMAASKGCSFRCAWCAKPIWGNRYQQREPQAVAAEMLELKARFAPDHIWFADDIFGFKAEWVQDFAVALQAGGGGLPFSIQSRADLITPAMAEALREAGCSEVWLGAESGSQQVLDRMNKGTTVEQIRTARERLGEQGIRTAFFIQLGYLGEQLEDLLATRRLIAETRPDDIGVSVSYPLPGTRFHEQVRQQLGPKTHWEDSGELAMMFTGRYSTDFYREVRDLLHEQVEVDRRHSGASEARAALGRRWASLLSTEPAHRSEAGLARSAS